ncbi:hypothetical protein B2G71_08350 [Novosphingobium sp. PC22D]|uniref:APC family permease n=1 Tax=Novosphingobium sp. PC22D TaxID=1962403 RepID=UPI000BFB11E1|nr:amino acid permease [Novosphingobium sp. PC22D]PEQ13425.1 hypothetical protein B2G71_08350 [Novosphingobium sp. PC22D]
MPAHDAPSLKPALPRWQLAVYGLGTILGTGIYVVVGKVAGEAGALAPVSFLVAAVAAALTALSYAELSARFPESGGSAAFIDHGFGRRWLTSVAGWALIATGLVSAATSANGFAGYLGVFVDLPPAIVVPAAVLALTLVAAKGVEEAAWFMLVTTALEVLGLVIVIVFAGGALSGYPEAARDALAAGSPGALSGGILLGAVLAFYAFIGFEDLATLSEEADDAPRAMPFAIVVSLTLALCFYLVIAAIAVSAVEVEALRDSEAPLADVVASNGGPARLLAIIGLATILNGALAQIVMAARVVHDLGARRGGAPAWLAAIHPRTRTPVAATLLSGAIVVALALAFPIATLAAGTSILILLIFAAACIALLLVKARGEPAGEGVRTWPAAVPALGALSCLGLVAAQTLAALG